MKYSFAELGLVDSPPDTAFDNLTKLARSLFKTPVSLVSIVDFENNRQYFKSQQGLVEPLATQRQTQLSHSFCQYVVKDNATLIVDNAMQHPKVKDNLAVADLGVASYLGSPIYSPDNRPIGSLCVIDKKTRQWTVENIEQLECLSNCVTDAIKLKVAHLDSEALRAQQADFSNAISHDIRSPMNTIQLVLEEVELEGASLSEDLQQLVAEGLGTLKRLKQQVSDVLQYSQTTHASGVFEATSLEELIEEILHDLKSEIRASVASIKCGKLPVIMGNRMQLRATFQNLISNALKYRIPEHKPIITIAATFSEHSGLHCIKLKDNGIGIALKDQESIFKLFTRLHREEQFAGSGVGLAVCHRVMANHHGSISVYSDGQNGSTFSLYFPQHKS